MKNIASVTIVFLLLSSFVLAQEGRHIDDEGVAWLGDTLNVGSFDQCYVRGDRLFAFSIFHGVSVYQITDNGNLELQEYRPRGLSDIVESYLITENYLFGYTRAYYGSDYFEFFSTDDDITRLSQGVVPQAPNDPYKINYNLLSMEDSLLIGQKEYITHVHRITPDLQIVPHDTLNLSIQRYCEVNGYYYIVPSLADSLLYTYRMLDCEFEVVDSFDVPISGEYPDYPVQVLVSNGNILSMYAWPHYTYDYTNIMRYRFDCSDPLHPEFIDAYDFGENQRFHYREGKRTPSAAVSVLNDSILVILTSHGNIATINRAFSDEPEVLDTLHVIANGDNVYYSGNVKIQSWYRDRIYLTTNYGIQSVDVSDPANLQYQQEVLVPWSVLSADQDGNRLALLEGIKPDSGRLTVYDWIDDSWAQLYQFGLPGVDYFSESTNYQRVHLLEDTLLVYMDYEPTPGITVCDLGGYDDTLHTGYTPLTDSHVRSDLEVGKASSVNRFFLSYSSCVSNDDYILHLAYLNRQSLSFTEIDQIDDARHFHRIHKGYLYYLNDENLLQIYRLSTNTRLDNPLSQLQLDDTPSRGLFLFDDFAFRRYDEYNYHLIEIIDVIDPSEPQVAGDWQGGAYYMDNWYALNDSLLITDNGELMDLTDFRSPITIGMINDDVYSAIVLSDTLLLVTSSGVSSFLLNGTTVRDEQGYHVIPFGFALYPAYPNPFNPSTILSFAVPNAGHVRLTVFDVLGREVTRLVDGTMTAGEYSYRWAGTNRVGNLVASGVYFYRLEGNGFTRTRSMILLK